MGAINEPNNLALFCLVDFWPRARLSALDAWLPALVASQVNLIVRPLFFYFLVYGFLGRKNGSVSRGKKNQNHYIGPIMSVVEKSYIEIVAKVVFLRKLHHSCVHCHKSILHKSSHTKLLPRYLNKQRKYLEEFSSRFCVIKLKWAHWMWWN